MSGSLSDEYLTEIKKQLAAVSEARGGCNVLYYYNKKNYLDCFDARQFTEAIRGLDPDRELVFILHIRGGEGDATLEIVEAMQKKFKDVTAIVPERAISAGTVIALSCNRLIISRKGRISQIDPMFEVYVAAKSLRLARKGNVFQRVINSGKVVAKLLLKLKALDAEEEFNESREKQAMFLENAGRNYEAVEALLDFFHDDPEHEHRDEFGYEDLTAQISDQHLTLELLEGLPEEEPVKKATRALIKFARKKPEDLKERRYLFAFPAPRP